ncbi:TKL protein kinase, variant [Aphanomyces invadans]|nr:TKL protein kinase, variant [Aphanomyces invadans]ETV94755.1 TKL protein kinase, variant [Aphanomyces invadans]|eukprot:XP_008876699.1 TKL protein kinase, variant [Aphanomyces invadans]
MLYMTHLEKLDLSRNNLADLNLTALVTSTSYPYLLHLTVQENALRSFDISAPSLVQLDLTGNQLTELPRCIYTMIDLLELYLANNSIPLPLHVTPYEFEFLSGLDYFYMDSFDSIVCNGDGSQLHMLKGNKICVTAHASGESAPASPPSDDTSWSYSTLSWILLVSGIIEAVVGVAVFMAYRKQKSHKWAALQHSYTTTASSGERERLLSVEHVIYASMEAWTSKTPLSEALEAEALRLDCDALSLDVRLAQGGYGEVWRGHYHHSLVAIKLLLPEKRAPADIEAFMREIVLLASLNHRHILQFLGVAWPKSKRDLMLVTEYVAGGDLRVLLDADPSRPWSQRKVQIAIDIAVAMEYLHALDIVHRDIKAKNVLVDAEHGAKLCDFGVAVHVYTLVGDGPDQQPATQGGFGTSRWIAPEVLSGERFTKAADVYAFGIVLSELDSHQIPYAHARTASGNDLTNVAILSQVVKGTMTPEFQDTCPDQVLHLARYCLHPNPKARPTASAVVGRLLEVVLPPCDVDSSTSQL